MGQLVDIPAPPQPQQPQRLTLQPSSLSQQLRPDVQPITVTVHESYSSTVEFHMDQDQDQIPPALQALIHEDFEMAPDLPNPLNPDPAKLLDCPDTPTQDEPSDKMNLDCSRELLSDTDVEFIQPDNTEDVPAAPSEDAQPALDPASR